VIFLPAALLTCVSGLGLLRVLRLATGRPAVDLPLGWLAGGAWFAAAAFPVRSLLGLHVNAPIAAAVLALPVVAWGVLRWARPGGAVTPAAAAGGARWVPRPWWLFAPMAAWVLLVAVAVGLHGMSTPTHTDDGYRVRAYAPILAAEGIWNGPARDVVTIAGPIPSFVPAVAWMLGAPIDPFHVNAAIVLTFLSLLVLLVALGSERGWPEAGWGAAFALTSLPLLAYHATSTYSDAWLAMYLGAAFAFLVAGGHGRDPADAGRALLLLLGASMVKREGELVALPAIAIVFAQVAWTGRAKAGRALLRLFPLLGAYLLVVAARIAAVGFPGAFPFLRAAALRQSEITQAVSGAAAGVLPAAPAAASATPAAPGGASATVLFVDALFRAGNLGLLYWVLALSVALLFPRIRKDGLAWSGAALALILAETAASAIWLYPQYTLDGSTVHRSLLPVSAAAAVWLAALLAAACRPASVAAPGPVPRARRRSSKVG
jgi:hypothetical protein